MSILIAADEFQCLDPSLRPNPLIAWLRQTCQTEVLNEVRRTDVPVLLAAAATIRSGAAPGPGQGFKIMAARGVPMAAAYLANAIAWRHGRTVAIITPSLSGSFARDVVDRVCRQSCGRQSNGPYAIRWDRSDDEEVKLLVDSLALVGQATMTEALAALALLPSSGTVREASAWVRHQARAAGKIEFNRDEIEAIIARQVRARRQRYGVANYDLTAMTVQQAKNRDFDGVAILWPYEVGGDGEHKRRLLYNAITRARRWCVVVVQNDGLLTRAPFI